VAGLVRRADASDAAAIAAVRTRTWQVGYRGIIPDNVLENMDTEGWARRAEVWLQNRDGPGRDWVADEAGSIVGWASRFLPGRDEDLGPTVAELAAIYVRPSHWGRGLGRALLEVVEADLRDFGATELSLWVVEENVRARRFYERQGFVPDGTRADSRVSPDQPVFSIRYRRTL